jgi:hypothetical protein
MLRIIERLQSAAPVTTTHLIFVHMLHRFLILQGRMLFAWCSLWLKFTTIAKREVFTFRVLVASDSLSFYCITSCFSNSPGSQVDEKFGAHQLQNNQIDRAIESFEEVRRRLKFDILDQKMAEMEATKDANLSKVAFIHICFSFFILNRLHHQLRRHPTRRKQAARRNRRNKTPRNS